MDEEGALKPTLAGINKKVDLGRQEEIGLIIYRDVAVFISNDYPGSGNRQVYFREADNIKRLTTIFEQKNLPIISLAENFESQSATLRCVELSLDRQYDNNKANGDSINDTKPCTRAQKANKQFEKLIEARRLSEDCTPIDGKVLIENYNGESITYTNMKYRCVKEERPKTITCKGKWVGDIKGCIRNQFSLLNWIDNSRKNVFQNNKLIRKLDNEIYDKNAK